MTAVKQFKCDRCGEIFILSTKEQPMVLFVVNSAEDFKIEVAEHKDLCGDCEANFSLFMTKVKEVNKVLEPFWSV